MGLVVGIWWPLAGIAAGIGLAFYFVGAVVSHLRVGDVKGIGSAVFMLVLAVGSARSSRPDADRLDLAQTTVKVVGDRSGKWECSRSLGRETHSSPQLVASPPRQSGRASPLTLLKSLPNPGEQQHAAQRRK